MFRRGQVIYKHGPKFFVLVSLPGRKGAVNLQNEINEKKTVRFEKCIGCSDMGMGCLGPNLLYLPISELKIWVKKWKEYYKLSLEQCAMIWNTPEGTAKRFVAAQETDFKYTTVQCIIRGIVGYGLPADSVLGDNPCPATSEEIKKTVGELEKHLEEKREECEYLLSRKQANANDYIERMAEQREHYEKNLANREESVRYLRELAEKRQRDLEKAEAIAKDYLDRIDVKNQQISERDAEIRHLNTEILRLSSLHNEEIKGLIDRILRLSDSHAAEIKLLTSR